MRKLMRWTGILLLAILLLPAAVLLMLYMPPAQEAAKRWATTWLTKQSGMEIQVAEVRLRYPLHIGIRGLRVERLFSIAEFNTHIRLRPLIHGNIEARHVSARGIEIHASTPMGRPLADISVQQFETRHLAYEWRKREAYVHDIQLTGNRIWTQENDTKAPASTTPIRLPLTVNVSGIRLHDTQAEHIGQNRTIIAKAEEIVLLHIAADTTLQVSLGSMDLHGGVLSIEQNDMSHWELTELSARADSLYYTNVEVGGQLTRLAFEETHGIKLREGKMALTWKEGVLSLPHFAFRTEHSTLSGQLRTSGYHTGHTSIDGKVQALIGHDDVQLMSKWAGGTLKEFTYLYPTETLSASIALSGPVTHLQLTRCDLSLPTAFDIKLTGVIRDITYRHKCQAQYHIDVQTYNLDFLTALADSSTQKLIAIPRDIRCQGDLHYAPDTLHTRCTLAINRGTATIEAGYRPTSQTYTLQLQTDSLDVRQIMPHGTAGPISMQAHITGNGIDFTRDETLVHAAMRLHTLQWEEQTYSNASVQIAATGKQMRANAFYNDTLMQWSLMTAAEYTPEVLRARLYVRLDDLNLKAFKITDTDIRPALQCHTTLQVDSAATYTLRSRLSDIVLRTSTQTIQPRPLDLNATLSPDTALLGISSGDLTLTANAHTEELPWKRKQTAILVHDGHPGYFTNLQATLLAQSDNPLSNYLALIGIRFRSLHATITDYQGRITSQITASDISAKGMNTDSIAAKAHYTDGTLQASLHTGKLRWSTPQMQLQGRASATCVWGRTFATDSLEGVLRLSDVRYTLPAYSLQLHTTDTLAIPLQHGKLLFTSLPLYTEGKQPLQLDGNIALLESNPTIRLRLTARDTDLLHTRTTNETQLYGKALVSGHVMLNGQFDALSITGNLRVRPGSSIHYIYKNAILTASNQLDNVVTFVSLSPDTDTQVAPGKKLVLNRLSINLNIDIDPTTQLEISLGTGQQNTVTVQGGGSLNLQYIPVSGVRLAGKYSIESGELNINIPLLHANHMAIRAGSTINWSGNIQNPQLDIAAEERIRASVTLDGSPQSVLFVTGVSFTDTLEKLGIQFTLTAPENASMQNTLAALSPEERSKLSVALLTTGLYLGEGGTGKLMNTALKSLLQSQIDNISRDAFRTVDVSVGIEPLPDGVSGVSTRTDYSFSVAKRFWNDRIRIIIGGSVTTTGERIESDAVIDNISIEWRINPVGNQYLRFFYDKNYESILEGEIRETGVGYAYRMSF